MTSREKVLAIFNRKGTGEGAMWTGHPNEATVPIYAEAWHIEPTREAIFSYLNDDCRWLDADDGYQHPSGRRAIDPAYGVERPTLSAPGCFADAETVADIEKYPWPHPAGPVSVAGTVPQVCASVLQAADRGGKEVQ